LNFKIFWYIIYLTELRFNNKINKGENYMSEYINDLNTANNKKSVRRDRCGIIISKITQVKNPVYQTKEEIDKKYWGKKLIISNMKHSPAGIRWVGGVVRYYSKTFGGLTDIIIEMDKDEEAYGRCDLIYAGGEKIDTLGGLGL
jgi:hypothetical protein